MKVRSPLIFEMGGKLGNAVAATARGGVTYFRALVTPRNPLTALQLAVRQALISAAAYWKSQMSESDQETWWDLAQGSQTGQTLFTRINQPRIYAINSERVRDDTGAITSPEFISYVTVPPDSFNVDMTTPTVSIDDSANTLTLSGFNANDNVAQAAGSDGDNSLLYVYASHQQNASRFSRQHPYQLIGVIRVETSADWGAMTPVIPLAALGFTTEAGKVMYVKVLGQAGGQTVDGVNYKGAISLAQEQRVTIVA